MWALAMPRREAAAGRQDFLSCTFADESMFWDPLGRRKEWGAFLMEMK